MLNFRTDLATERRDIFQKANKIEQINGVQSEKQDINENIAVERVTITNEEGEKNIGKPMGKYITIDIKNLKLARDEELQQYGKTVGDELKKIIDSHVNKQDEILVVGLGNLYVTPDSLGPKVINEIEDIL